MRERINIQKQVGGRTRKTRGKRAHLCESNERGGLKHAHIYTRGEREGGGGRGASSLDAIRRVKPSSTTTHTLTAEVETVNEPERLLQLYEAE